jgi:uncharacterized repeat protein (TIGR03803 family)
MKKTITTVKVLLIVSIVGLVISHTNAQNQKQFWGMAFGGPLDAGIMFKTDASGNNEMVKYSFVDWGDPWGSLMRASDGNLYGMTYYGGANNTGCLFQYNPRTWTYTIKYDFNLADGRRPKGTLMQASDGMIYGTTTEGGNKTINDDHGVLFKYNPLNNTYTKLFDFEGATSGTNPFGALIQATDGMLYGMTNLGGANDKGILFQFNPVTNTFTKKLDFDGTSKGRNPYGSLMQASDGMLYGMTHSGGTNDVGVLFQFNPTTSAYTKKIDFDMATNGGNPDGSLIQATDGKLYGLTEAGGPKSSGILFQFNITNSAFVDKYDFDDSPHGSSPWGSLMQGYDGNFYGMTRYGGTVGGPTALGVIFQFNPISNTFTKKLDFNATNGENPRYTNLIEIPVTITTSAVSLTNCAGSTISVAFSIQGAYDTGNVFSAQLSDASGSFASPVYIGSITSPFIGTISAIIPANTAQGSGYRIRVVGTMPVVTGSDNGSNITINALPNVNTVRNAGTITVNQSSGATYQWVNCNTGYSVITGATNQSYTPTINGSYAVIVTMNGTGCSATSTCVNITNAGVNDVAANNQFRIYPNPSSDYITVDIPEKAKLEIINIEGQVIKTINNDNILTKIDIRNLTGGIYIIRAKTNNAILTGSFTKE